MLQKYVVTPDDCAEQSDRWSTLVSIKQHQATSEVNWSCPSPPLHHASFTLSNPPYLDMHLSREMFLPPACTTAGLLQDSCLFFFFNSCSLLCPPASTCGLQRGGSSYLLITPPADMFTQRFYGRELSCAKSETMFCCYNKHFNHNLSELSAQSAKSVTDNFAELLLNWDYLQWIFSVQKLLSSARCLWKSPPAF